MIQLLRTHLRAYRSWLLAVLVLQAVQATASLLLPSLNADIIDSGHSVGDTGYIWRIGAIMPRSPRCKPRLRWRRLLRSQSPMGFGRDVRGALGQRVVAFSAKKLTFGAPSAFATASSLTAASLGCRVLSVDLSPWACQMADLSAILLRIGSPGNRKANRSTSPDASGPISNCAGTEFGQCLRFGARDAAEVDEFAEEPLEAGGGDDLQDPGGFIAGVPEGVPLVARLEYRSPGPPTSTSSPSSAPTAPPGRSCIRPRACAGATGQPARAGTSGARPARTLRQSRRHPR